MLFGAVLMYGFLLNSGISFGINFISKPQHGVNILELKKFIKSWDRLICFPGRPANHPNKVLFAKGVSRGRASCPIIVYAKRPPSNLRIHAIGWSLPIGLPPASLNWGRTGSYVDSSSVNNTSTPSSVKFCGNSSKSLWFFAVPSTSTRAETYSESLLNQFRKDRYTNPMCHDVLRLHVGRPHHFHYGIIL